MAWNDDKNIWYWNGAATATTSTTGTSWASNTYAATSATAATTCYFWVEKPRRIWVELPETWSQEWLDDWVRLVNSETDTGWKVTAIIKGKVCVVDPNDEIRSLDDFVPLFRSYCGKDDAAKLDAFLASHPSK